MVDHGDDITTAQFAHMVAERASEEMTLSLSSDGGGILQLMVYRSVLRAFGCTCRHDKDSGDESVYFEDLICPLHGMGPIDLTSSDERKTEPGS